MNIHYTIHTLPILRNEIKMYPDFKRERDKLIQEYVKPLRRFYLEFYEVEEELTKIKSPGQGDGLGGYVQEKNDQFNYLIEKKDKLRKSIVEYVQKNEKNYLEDLEFWNTRIETAEYYLSKMDTLDKKFIEDFYYNLSKKSCMERYNITNIKSLYRKADNILKNLLEKQ